MFLAHKCKSNIDFKLWFGLHQLFSLSLTLSISSLVLDLPHTVHWVYQRLFFLNTVACCCRKLLRAVRRYKCSKCAGPLHCYWYIIYCIYIMCWHFLVVHTSVQKAISPGIMQVPQQALNSESAASHTQWMGAIFFSQSVQLQLPMYLDFLALCFTSPDISYAWYLDTFVYTCMQNWTLVS